MADKLNLCPFCGGKAVVVEEYLSEEADASADEISYFVSCGSCASRTDNYATEKRAIEAWNNRPSPWHTGTPQEEGVYVIKVSNRTYFPYILATWVNNEWLTKEIQIPVEDYVAWQKITQFEGEE